MLQHFEKMMTDALAIESEIAVAAAAAAVAQASVAASTTPAVSTPETPPRTGASPKLAPHEPSANPPALVGNGTEPVMKSKPARSKEELNSDKEISKAGTAAVLRMFQ